MRRPPKRRSPRDLLFVGWLVVTALLLLQLLRGGAAAPVGGGAAGEGRGRPRSVPMEQLLRKMRGGQLSDHPARYARPAAAAARRARGRPRRMRRLRQLTGTKQKTEPSRRAYPRSK